ncbi:MAG: hypothetical protein U5N55_11695 [Cypionkella sp.]|nr:hypothetical protein [Cypionkella sp.]
MGLQIWREKSGLSFWMGFAFAFMSALFIATSPHLIPFDIPTATKMAAVAFSTPFIISLIRKKEKEAIEK